MFNTVRTHMGALLQTAQKQRAEFVIPKNTTLNQTFGVFPDMVTDSVLTLGCNYFCIGVGGYNSELGTNGLRKSSVTPHEPWHMGLYQYIPHVIRPVTNDLTAAERERFRMRAVITIGTTQYAAYYLRVLPTALAVPSVKLAVGNNPPVAWSFPVDALTPALPILKTGQVMTTGDDTLRITCPYEVPFTETDVTEILNAAQLLFGDEGYGCVVEIGICAGTDKRLPGNFDGLSVTYTEAISCFITDFMSTKMDFPVLTQGGVFTFEAGAAEPMLVLTSV